ncbi:MAG: tetratricopeptide repeat protein [Phycisphaeraceae bacterium]
MAKQTDNPPLASSPPRDGSAPVPDQRPLSQLWQVPVLLAGALMMGVGLYMVITSSRQPLDFPGALNTVEKYLDANEFDDAQRKLTAIASSMPRADRPQRARYEMLGGDLIYLRQRANGRNIEAKHLAVLAQYETAREVGQEFDGRHRTRWAETLMALGRDQEALRFVDQLEDQPVRQRYLLIKRLIQRQQQRPDGKDPQKLAPLLAQFMEELRSETDKQARRAEELWATAMRAQVLLDVDNPRWAIGLLQRRIMLFMDQGDDDDLAPLMVLLGKAHLKIGDYDESQRYFQLAQTKLLSADPLHADILVGLADIELALSNVQQALEYYSRAERDWPAMPVYLLALVGRADCEAKLGYDPDAIEHFGRAVKLLNRTTQTSDPRRQALTDVVLSHYDKYYDQQGYDRALDYLSLLKPLYEPKLPADLLLRMAVTHERVAEQQLADAAQEVDEQSLADASAAASMVPVLTREARAYANRQAAFHYARAAEHYAAHGRAVSTIDDAAYGESLWKAAGCYDRAQRWKDAIRVYDELVRTRSTDPRQLQVIHKLAMAYMADKQYPPALELFVRLIERHPRSPESYASLVPLARCHIELNQLDHADRTLQHVITDHPAITPESRQYRQALIEIGKLYYRQEKFEAAIERLDEAVKRYGHRREGGALRFLLADSYRRAAGQLQDDLELPLPQSKRQALQAQRAAHLETGQQLYGQAIADLEAPEGDDLSAIEALYLRNAYFYRGDCAYDLGRFETAIELYDQAAKRWEMNPASLVALVQIVNAYCELGQKQEARAANRRARAHLKLIPEQAFDDPSLPMTRQHWQDWLRWTSELNLFEPQASAAGAITR